MVGDRVMGARVNGFGRGNDHLGMLEVYGTAYLRFWKGNSAHGENDDPVTRYHRPNSRSWRPESQAEDVVQNRNHR